MYLKSIIQPSKTTTIGMLCDCANGIDIKSMDIVVAYITTSGFREFKTSIEETLGNRWNTIRKRWITSFDYLRTEPAALHSILELPRSNLRIHNSAIVNRTGCIPSTPFHPKVFITRGQQAERVLAGSGNMSRSGLRRGHEAGIAVGISKPHLADEAVSRGILKSYKSWFKTLWDDADVYGGNLMAAYKLAHQSVPNLKNPAPTEDDVLPLNANQLTGEDLRKLRVCDNFWIEAGNITKNLGHNRPGNQLMMKRLSRVFFGVPPIDVPQNSPLTHITIAFENQDVWPCSLTFSDNGMDKVTLPPPGGPGPIKYDNENLIFTRTGVDTFSLRLGTTAQKNSWIKRSKAIGANFSMSSGGRIWGVF